jgi:hypothetical protein
MHKRCASVLARLSCYFGLIFSIFVLIDSTDKLRTSEKFYEWLKHSLSANSPKIKNVDLKRYPSCYLEKSRSSQDKDKAFGSCMHRLDYVPTISKYY